VVSGAESDGNRGVEKHLPGATPDPHWTVYVSALGTPLIAAVAAIIAGWSAYRQWRTARDSLRFDLFEKRLTLTTEFGI
jgi:hypothetical protein